MKLLVDQNLTRRVAHLGAVEDELATGAVVVFSQVGFDSGASPPDRASRLSRRGTAAYRSVTHNVGSYGHAKVTLRSRPVSDVSEPVARNALR